MVCWEGFVYSRMSRSGEYRVSERNTFPYSSIASVTDCSEWSVSTEGSAVAGQPYQQASVTINTIGDADRSPTVTFTNMKQTWDSYRHTDIKVNRIPVGR